MMQLTNKGCYVSWQGHGAQQRQLLHCTSKIYCLFLLLLCYLQAFLLQAFVLRSHDKCRMHLSSAAYTAQGKVWHLKFRARTISISTKRKRNADGTHVQHSCKDLVLRLHTIRLMKLDWKLPREGCIYVLKTRQITN
jgi:hypothetical protein